jgi:NADH-quinone oxidoreductase subunit J
MSIDLLVFLVLALIAVGAALGMLFSRNTVYAVLFLVLVMLTLAVLYLILGAPFLALAQVTVYAGAIMVLFLFAVMILGPQELQEQGGPIGWQRPTASGLAVLFLGVVVYAFAARVGGLGVLRSAGESAGAPFAIGQLLFNRYLLPFEVTSVLLLVAAVGAVVLTKER